MVTMVEMVLKHVCQKTAGIVFHYTLCFSTNSKVTTFLLPAGVSDVRGDAQV